MSIIKPKLRTIQAPTCTNAHDTPPQPKEPISIAVSCLDWSRSRIRPSWRVETDSPPPLACRSVWSPPPYRLGWSPPPYRPAWSPPAAGPLWSLPPVLPSISLCPLTFLILNNYVSIQLCGSRMFIPDPRSELFPTQIPDQNFLCRIPHQRI
jgi:hypothetical protein